MLHLRLVIFPFQLHHLSGGCEMSSSYDYAIHFLIVGSKAPSHLGDICFMTVGRPPVWLIPPVIPLQSRLRYMIECCKMCSCHAIAQMVSHWLPTVGVWIRSLISSLGICGRHSGTGADFLQLLLFPLPFLIPQNA